MIVHVKQIILERYKTIMANSDNKIASILYVRVEKRHSKAKDADYYVQEITWNLPSGEDYVETNFITAEQYALILLSQPLDSNSRI